MAVEEHGTAEPLDNWPDQLLDRPMIGPMRLLQAIVQLVASRRRSAIDSRTGGYVRG